MMRQKTMLMFKAILVVTALCLVAPSDAGDDCVYCDPKTGNEFNYCVMNNMAKHPDLKNFMPSLKKMALDLDQVGKDMNIDGPMKDNAMKGALAWSLGSMAGKDKNSTEKIEIITGICRKCFQDLHKEPDNFFLQDCKEKAAAAAKKNNLSSSQQPQNQTQPDKVIEALQSVNYPPQNDNVPQIQKIQVPISLSKDKINPNQNEYQRYPVSQQQDSILPASAYPGPQKNQRNRLPYKSEQAQWQQPTANQGYANAAAVAYSSVESQPRKQQYPPWYIPNAQDKKPVNTYKPQQNYEVNPNAYPNSNRDVFANNANNPSYAQTPVTWNNGGNSQQYRVNSGYYPGIQNPITDDWAHSQNKYLDISWSDAPEDTLTYPNPRRPNKDFYNQPFPSSKSAPSQDIPPNDYAYSYSSAKSSATSSSYTNDGGSYANAFSSSDSNSKSPDNNQKYPLPETTQRKPNPNVLTTGNEPQPDVKQQNVPSAKDDKTSKATVFYQTLYGEMCDAPSLKKVFNEETTKKEKIYALKYIILYALTVLGYPKEMAQKCAYDSNNFVNAMPQDLSTPMKVEAFCEMVKMQFISTNMIGDNPDYQAKCLGNAMKKGLEQLPKWPASPGPQQNLSSYPIKDVNLDDSNPNKYPANPQGKLISVPNKDLNNMSDLDDKPIRYDEPKKNKNDQPNADTDRKTSNRGDYPGYPAPQTPQIRKQPDFKDNEAKSSAVATAVAGSNNNPAYFDDDWTYGDDDDWTYGDDGDDDWTDSDDGGTISPQDPNLPPNQPKQPKIYNVNDPSPDDKLKQPSLQLYPLGDPQKPDTVKNNTAVNPVADSNDTVKMLLKLTLACLKGGNMNYTNYSKGIENITKMRIDKNPEMGPETAKTLTLIDALWTVLEILKSILKGNPDAIKQLLTPDDPLKLKQNTLPKYLNPQEINPNPDNQTGKAIQKPQGIQDTPLNLPAIPPLTPVENIPASPPPWKKDYNNNPNSYTLNQPQAEPRYPYPALQPINSNNLPNKVPYNNWNADKKPWQNTQNLDPSLKNFAYTPQFVQPVIPDKPASLPAIQSPVPVQSIAYTQNYNTIPYPPIQNTFTPQAKPTYINRVPQLAPSNIHQYKAENYNRYDTNQAQPNNQFFPFGNTPNQPIVSSYGNNIQNPLGIEAGFQQERVNNPNEIRNRDKFGMSYAQSNANLPSVGPQGNQRFSQPNFPNLPQNQDTYPQDRAINTQDKANNWYPQPTGLNTAGNQGVPGASQTGNYQGNSFPPNNFQSQGNRWK